MKKNVFFALFALAALVFVGCDPTPTPTPTPDDPTTEGAVITVTPEALLMGVGEEQKLTTTVAPQGTQLQITWTSDNQEVATVNAAGIVTAVAAGKANIIASAEGATADTCVVTVSNDAALDNFVLSGYGCFGDFSSEIVIPGTDTVLTISVGEVKCKLGWNELYAWDENIVFVDGSGFSGAGFMMVASIPTYFIVEGDYAGYYIDFGYFGVTEGAQTAYVGEAGKILDVNKYGDAMKTFINPNATEEELKAAAESYVASMQGTQIFMIDWDNQSQSDYLGNVKYALAGYDEEGSLLYDLKMEWFDFVNEGRLLGLAYEEVVTEAGDTTEVLVEPYDMRFINKEYSNMPVEEEVAAMVNTPSNTWMPKKPCRFNAENVFPKFDTKKMYKK